ncbi:nucleoside hydrolase [Ferrimonas kyonanensis]|uniref:nucleoside hydrolase n=1 Tax=Ferrimonas kyonanensis TaxID=364763 RepID=UPI00040189CF|nr:nucleoside hydrolase [Ferrimonas kyonanensis]
MSQKIIFDTDPGIDDAMALLFAHAHDNVDMVAITTVYGNGVIEDCTRNACYINDTFNMGATVVQGAAGPLTREPVGPTVVVHGEHGLGTVEVPLDYPINIDPRPAHEYMCDMARENPGEITLVAVGPLTNLALALQHDPEIVNNVKEVVIMGAAFGEGGHRGNVSPVAEANIHDDPHAADQVFCADWPVTIVGLDVTHQTFFTGDYLDKLRHSAGEVGEFIWQVSRFYLKFYSEKVGVDGCHVHDPSAVAYVADPSLFGVRKGPVRVVTEGPAIGMTIQKSDERFYHHDEWSCFRAQQVCVEVDNQRLLQMYQDSINSLA